MGQGSILGLVRITIPIMRAPGRQRGGPLSGQIFNDRLWPVVTVGTCYRKAAVGIQSRKLSGSLRVPKGIHPTGQLRTLPHT